MPYTIDTTTMPGVLWLRLWGSIKPVEMESFLAEHNAAIDAFGGRVYRVLCDVRRMSPLSPQASVAFESAKAYSAAHMNFQGSAVLVDSALVALQHERTSTTAGVMSTELITDSEEAALNHLSNIDRKQVVNLPRTRSRSQGV